MSSIYFEEYHHLPGDCMEKTQKAKPILSKGLK